MMYSTNNVTKGMMFVPTKNCNTLVAMIGVKRNAERYKFWEPRPPVDAVWARSRRSRFSMCNAQPDLNFFVTFAQKALLGPKSPFWPIFRFLGPKVDFGVQNALLVQKSTLGRKGLHFG